MTKKELVDWLNLMEDDAEILIFNRANNKDVPLDVLKDIDIKDGGKYLIFDGG